MKRCRPALPADMRRLSSLVLAVALVCTLVSRGMPVSAAQAESNAPVSVEVTSPPADATLVTEEPAQLESTEAPPTTSANRDLCSDQRANGTADRDPNCTGADGCGDRCSASVVHHRDIRALTVTLANLDGCTVAYL